MKKEEQKDTTSNPAYEVGDILVYCQYLSIVMEVIQLGTPRRHRRRRSRSTEAEYVLYITEKEFDDKKESGKTYYGPRGYVPRRADLDRHKRFGFTESQLRDFGKRLTGKPTREQQ